MEWRNSKTQQSLYAYLKKRSNTKPIKLNLVQKSVLTLTTSPTESHSCIFLLQFNHAKKKLVQKMCSYFDYEQCHVKNMIPVVDVPGCSKCRC
jgi:hypothetical protein